jgi:hypothetical protein
MNYVWDFDNQLRSALLSNGAHVPHSDLRTSRSGLFISLEVVPTLKPAAADDLTAA